MVIEICPHCNARYTRMSQNTDFVHDCNIPEGETARKNEDLLVTGQWQDYTGSGGKPPTEVMMQGAVNKLFGTRAAIEGEDEESVNIRGNPKDRYRSRRHEEFIDKSCLSDLISANYVRDNI